MRRIVIISIFLFVSFVTFSQNEKKIIIVNVSKRSITNTTPKIKINGIPTPRIVYKSFIVQRCNTDSIEIKIPYHTIFLKEKVNTFHFAIKDKNNYFCYSYEGLISIPIIKQVIGEDLVKLKKSNYVKEKMKEYNLE